MGIPKDPLGDSPGDWLKTPPGSSGDHPRDPRGILFLPLRERVQSVQRTTPETGSTPAWPIAEAAQGNRLRAAARMHNTSPKERKNSITLGAPPYGAHSRPRSVAISAGVTQGTWTPNGRKVYACTRPRPTCRKGQGGRVSDDGVLSDATTGVTLNIAHCNCRRINRMGMCVQTWTALTVTLLPCK